MGNATSQESSAAKQPTLTFPRPPPDGQGTKSLCSKCLTLLSSIITEFGDGSGYEGSEMPHFVSIADISPSGCVICQKMMVLFDDARAHISFEGSLRATPLKDWRLTWALNVRDSAHYPQHKFPHDCVAVLINTRHARGYSWGIGGFQIYPDRELQRRSQYAPQETSAQKHLTDYENISALDPPSGTAAPGSASSSDFTSTAGTSSMALIHAWAIECAQKHPKCHRVFSNDGIDKPAAKWYPDRLIRLSTRPDKEKPDVVRLDTRIVEKSDPNDFPVDKYADGVPYISLSHCWGPAPDPNSDTQGREKHVLMREKLAAWKKDMPIEDLPLTFRDAATVCLRLGFEHIWIDSLTIIQFDKNDWKAQSVQMADVYKHAWLNIAAMSSKSDAEGFINNDRDTRVDYGFRAPFAQILGRSATETNKSGQRCTLLAGNAVLVWKAAPDIPGSTGGNAPLFKRAWVFQERSLSRRTLGFTQRGVFWACDEFERCENSNLSSSLEVERLRGTQHSVVEALSKLRALDSSPDQAQTTAARNAIGRQLMQTFDHRWKSAIDTYTSCGLTYQPDKLMAISAVAREYAASGLTVQSRYLAGLWETRMVFQLGWTTVVGQTTPRRKLVGEEGYVAPSWSWASIEAPMLARPMFPDNVVALAEVVAADVALEQKDFQFGQVTAGWLRIRGRLRTVASVGWKDSSVCLTDRATRQDLWFSTDTVEGMGYLGWRGAVDKLVWMPLALEFQRGALSARCLVLVEASGGYGDGGDFVRPGEKVYRRLGSGNFGRLPSRLQQDPLLQSLGTYPDVDIADDDAGKMQAGFRPNDGHMEDFVLI